MKSTIAIVVSMILAALGLFFLVKVMDDKRDEVNKRIELCVESGGVPIVGYRGHLPYLKECVYKAD